jgi:phospholipid/cholesterol/gamma-HCH transport system substrate-binding protein
MAVSAEKKVGILFFLGVALLALFTIVLTDIRIFRKQYQVTVTFDQVGGLEKGNKVTLGGMEVGVVKALVQRKGRIQVVLGIEEEVEIPRDSVFRLGDIGLLGGKRVDIIWGDEASGFVADGDLIEGKSSPGLSEAIASLGDAGDNVDQILVSIRETAEKISRGEGTVGKLISEDDIYRDIRSISERIASGQGTIGRLVNDPELYEDLRKLFSDLQQLLEENRRKVEEIVEEFQEAAPAIKGTARNLEEITGKINRGEGTIGKLINEDELYTDARATLTSVDTAGQKLTDMLTKAERIRIFLGAEAAYNTRSKHSLTKAYFEIEPTPSKLYRVGFSLLAGEGTEADRTDDPSTELDAQIGLRFFDNRLTVRGGLLEGRVGGGLDLRIWGEDLVLTVEGRDVWSKEKDENIDPFLLRAYIDTNVWWGFYLRLGGDNLLDEPGFYGGAGLKLRDDDIKALFGFISF